VELRDGDLVEILELGAVREVGFLLLFFLGFLLGFLGFLLGFRRFLVVGPTRARARERWDDGPSIDGDVSRTRRRASPLINHSAHDTCGERRVRSFDACRPRSALSRATS
jgi:hypothetical protein